MNTRLLTRRHVRVAVGALWLLDAGLQAQPHLFNAEWWRDDLSQSVMGQPALVARSILSAVGLIAAHPAAWNAAFVAAQAMIGLCLVSGRFERAAIAASIPWALGIWWIGEGLGGLPTGFGLFAAGAPGPVLYDPLLELLAWPHPAPAPTKTGRTSGVSLAAGEVWAALWASGAVLAIPFTFAPGRVLRANLAEHSLDQPAWLAGISHHVSALVGDHPVLIPAALAAVEAAIGVGVFFRPARRVALGAGIAAAVVVWFAFENLGGIPGGDATDPGAAPLLIILALSMWPARNQGPALQALPLRPASPLPRDLRPQFPKLRQTEVKRDSIRWRPGVAPTGIETTRQSMASWRVD